MRFLLLSLALLYAAIPPGLCACQLQSTILHSVLSLNSASVDSSQDQDDNDDAPGECHCVGTKQLCNTTPAPQIDVPAGSLMLVADAATTPQFAVTVFADPVPGSAHRSEAPLYLTLRALRI